MRRKAFTLMEVLVATAVAGLVITAGFRLIAMSYRLLGEIQWERELISAAQDIWLRF
ncbi:MAG: prepilin-type N-terminal cleavage/methylation domain-containing protein, partial [Synergistaceae bacterium]|nr:prepilin-type N-terminal cleavage/methylation domain-containing protein [Synergistaceae bacterium]